MVDVLEGFGVAESEDPIGIESALWNASLDGCKEGLPALRSSDDEANVGGQEHKRNVHISDHVRINGVDCGGALVTLIQILQSVLKKAVRSCKLTGRVI
jgi:hypothetical protein